MKFTLRKGLLRLAIAAGGFLLGVSLAQFFPLLVICTVLGMGLVLWWVIRGFFDMKRDE